MNKFIVAMSLAFSMNAFAIDLSNDQVASPVADANEITTEIAGRGAFEISPVVCKQSGTLSSPILKCSTTRSIVENDQFRQEGFGCWFEYEENKDGSFTRTVWECPIL